MKRSSQEVLDELVRQYGYLGFGFRFQTFCYPHSHRFVDPDETRFEFESLRLFASKAYVCTVPPPAEGFSGFVLTRVDAKSFRRAVAKAAIQYDERRRWFGHIALPGRF